MWGLLKLEIWELWNSGKRLLCESTAGVAVTDKVQVRRSSLGENAPLIGASLLQGENANSGAY